MSPLILSFSRRSFKFLHTRKVIEIGTTMSYSSTTYNYEVTLTCPSVTYIYTTIEQGRHHFCWVV